MFVLRKWSVRQSRALEWLYQRFEATLTALHPVWRRIGYQRLEGVAAFVEKPFKGLLFDCKMCGDCALSSTGMSCPMNCPKQMRNGPCGGVRGNGNCEVKPDMPCVWVEAWKGSRNMRHGNKLMALQAPVDWSIQGASSWLRRTQEMTRP